MMFMLMRLVFFFFKPEDGIRYLVRSRGLGDVYKGQVPVAVAASLLGEPFPACQFIRDYLKPRAPFWKREFTADGARWVEAHAADEQAAERWQT